MPKMKAAAPAAATALAAPSAPKPPVEAAPPAAGPAPAARANASQPLWNSLDPIAAAGAAGVLALAGAGVALGRRRRRRLEDEDAASWDYETSGETEDQDFAPDTMEEIAPAAAEPAAVAPAQGENRLPNGFDLSRFGPHVQAAYRGPTPDNPSLSLRHRLRRAAVMDQAARRAAENRSAAQPDPVVKTGPTAPNPQFQRANGPFMFTRATAKPALTPAE